jgi:hypothetical protein
VDVDHAGIQSPEPNAPALQQVRSSVVPLRVSCFTLLTPLRFNPSRCTTSMAMWFLGKEVMFVLGPSRTLLLYLAAGTHTHAPPPLHRICCYDPALVDLTTAITMRPLRSGIVPVSPGLRQ